MHATLIHLLSIAAELKESFRIIINLPYSPIFKMLNNFFNYIFQFTIIIRFGKKANAPKALAFRISSLCLDVEYIITGIVLNFSFPLSCARHSQPLISGTFISKKTISGSFSSPVTKASSKPIPFSNALKEQLLHTLATASLKNSLSS